VFSSLSAVIVLLHPFRHLHLNPCHRYPAFSANNNAPALWRRVQPYRRPMFIAVVGLSALGLTAARSPIQCDTQVPPPQSPNNLPSTTNNRSSGTSDPPLPKSEINIYNLGFGSVMGICTGVFVKKGLKTVAFLIGGVFVMLQVKRATLMFPLNKNTNVQLTLPPTVLFQSKHRFPCKLGHRLIALRVSARPPSRTATCR
jgi:uncharacterized membrane protein (Fun14 family)